MKTEQSYWVTYRGGRDKGFAETNKIVKATSKTDARRKLLDEIPTAVIKEINPVVCR